MDANTQADIYCTVDELENDEGVYVGEIDVVLRPGVNIRFPPRTPDDQIKKVARQARERHPANFSPAPLTMEQAGFFYSIIGWPPRVQKAIFEEWGICWLEDGVPIPPPVFFDGDELK